MAGYIGSRAAVATSGVERKKTFAITTTTTSLTGLDYTPNHVHVFHNGIRLVDGTDYTATNGTSITLVNAAENGDEVVVVSLGTFSPADTYTKTEADDRYVNASGDTMTGNLVVAQGASLVKSFANNTEEYLIKGTDQSAYQPYISHTPSYDTPDRGIRMGVWDNNGTKTDWLKIWNGHVTMPYQPYIYGSPTNTGGSGYANSFYTVSARGGMAFSSDRITVPVGGVYHISFNTICDLTTGRVDAGIRINGGAFVEMLNEDNGTGYHYKSGSLTVLLAANDYIQFNNNDWYAATNTSFNQYRTASVALIG